MQISPFSRGIDRGCAPCVQRQESRIKAAGEARPSKVLNERFDNQQKGILPKLVPHIRSIHPIDMIISCLVENTGLPGYETEHGLSIHVRTSSGLSVLFDTGQSGHLLIQNAQKMGIDLSDVDILVISHGHYDHGGGLRSFLESNHKAAVLLRESAFEPHASLHGDGMHDIGLDQGLKDHPRIRLVKEDILDLEKGLVLFTTPSGSHTPPCGSERLKKGVLRERDDFSHEMCMAICEGENRMLLSGCAHKGILNIMDRAESILGKAPTHVIGGMHLKDGPSAVHDLKDLADGLLHFKGTEYLTCHCTGIAAYDSLKVLMKDRIRHLSTGMRIEIVPPGEKPVKND